MALYRLRANRTEMNGGHMNLTSRLIHFDTMIQHYEGLLKSASNPDVIERYKNAIKFYKGEIQAVRNELEAR